MMKTVRCTEMVLTIYFLFRLHIINYCKNTHHCILQHNPHTLVTTVHPSHFTTLSLIICGRNPFSHILVTRKVGRENEHLF